MYEKKYTVEWEYKDFVSGFCSSNDEDFTDGAAARVKAFELCHTKGVREIRLLTKEIWRDENDRI